ncbi:hypothetical protein JY97_07080 [Alkalispirochaeta odontotermitis]|nr:hypothetical protein JY97_07080 [Alkalispirochaeta odontotermitis]CAB1080245.1 hypothetical protein D1AOALGA4SA_7932 [Olavius algarvensis Delta 1 endosymbiont]
MKISKLIIQTLAPAILITVFALPANSPAQKTTLQGDANRIELTRENEFVVRMMDVVNISGKSIKGLVELDFFDNDKKVFNFKKANGKIQKVSHTEIKQIVFNRLRQGVLTGKPQSLRVIVWNGKTKNIVVNYREAKIKNGYLYLNQKELSRHFDDADRLKAGSYEWSEKLNNFWQGKKAESPEVFSTNFAFENGQGVISRKMAAAYCRTCVKIEILRLKIDPKKKTLSIRCKDVFYDKYNE